ncbi:MAG: protein kinase [Desulfobacteraceae bacterium IS3]|nr:MAG: protein kinase [Desulfobacteraceae bacterium IS3]
MGNRIVTDTTDFFSIDSGDEIHIAGKRYKVTGHARELRFGVEDPKFWVKRVWDMDTEEKKIIKLSFLESFDACLGGVKIKCFRNPDKEGNILDLTKDNPCFMNGKAYRDLKENNVRIIDVVRGPNFLTYLGSFKMSYDIYFHTVLPGILKELIKTFEAVSFLHQNGFRHGDIRNDHIIKDTDSGNLVWIDFDYDFQAPENPFSLDIFGLGNILLYAVGKGFHTYYMIKNDTFAYHDLIGRIMPEDFSLLDERRFVNLRKLYPLVPESLNDILMHFSRGANVYYEAADEITEDLKHCLKTSFAI